MVFFFQTLSSFYFFPLFFHASEWPLNSAKRFKGALLALQWETITTLAATSQGSWALNTQTIPSRPNSFKRNLRNKANWMFLNVPCSH